MDGKLYKYGDISVELQCIELCRKCGISVENADETDSGIAIYNITSPMLMLEQADQSGRLDPDDFDEQTIIDLFGKAGAQMLIIDAVIGNGDRHLLFLISISLKRLMIPEVIILETASCKRSQKF